MDDDKKERVLHTRVSSSLDNEIREKANKLGVSVSNLVRNVLSNAVGMVEDIVIDSSRLAKAATGPGMAATVAGVAQVGRPLGWRELVLNVNAICADCNSILPRGANASMAVFRGVGPDTFLCTACLASIKNNKDGSDD